MKKDIPDLKVEDIALAIVPRDEDLWDSYIINLKDTTIESVLINSKGYGNVDGEEVKTTVLRHFFEEIGPLRCVLIEPVQPKLFELTNEYWVSFVQNGHMYDKKYVFVRGSIHEEHFTTIPLINRNGVMIR